MYKFWISNKNRSKWVLTTVNKRTALFILKNLKVITPVSNSMQPPKYLLSQLFLDITESEINSSLTSFKLFSRWTTIMIFSSKYPKVSSNSNHFASTINNYQCLFIPSKYLLLLISLLLEIKLFIVLKN